MGFFFVENRQNDKRLKGLSQDFLRRHECNVCPLNSAACISPKMLPSGSKSPTVLMIGEAPGKTEDERGKQFVGKSGNVLRFRIPKDWDNKIRWSNAVNCRPPDNRTPDNIELQCCSPRLERDVAATKPKAIFGFGHTPLTQIVNPDGKYAKISLWRGRRLPVNVGGHVCWYYPMFHPSYILRKRKFEPRDLNSYGSEDEFAFALDIKNALAEIESLPEPLVHAVEDAAAGIELVDDINRVAELLAAVSDDPSVGIDIETNCLRPYSKGAKILSIALSGKQYTFSFAVDHSQVNWTKLERKQLDVLIKRFLYEARCRKVVHHLAFELEWFGFFYGTGCFYTAQWEDSESAAYVIDSRRGSLSLDFLCLQYFGFKLKAISGLDRKNLDKSPIKSVLKYNAIDARYHRLLWLTLVKIIKQIDMLDVYDHQMRRIPALVSEQLQGVPVDQKVVEGLKEKYQQRADQAKAAIIQESVVVEFERRKNKKFNPSSPSDVFYLLNQILGLELENSDKNELAHVDHPIAKKIVAWREPNKVLSTYIESIDSVSEESNLFPDGMLHPIISSTTVKSARTSSEGPNIQNWPNRDEELREIRSQVKDNDVDVVIVSFDYAGIQARNVAMESLDKKLIDAFFNNYDIHSDWRERIVKKYPKWIPKSKLQDKEAMEHYRHLSKNKFVFPTFFGAQAFNTSEGLGIPKNICEELLEEFFEEFPDIKKWHQSLDKFYLKNGYVTGLSGYRCYAPVSTNQRINLPIQGDEAKIVMDAMIRLTEMQDPRYIPMLMIHDDLTFRMPKKEVEKRSEVILKTMLNCPFEWANVVPTEIEMKVGPDWINQKKIGKFRNDQWNGIVEIEN